MKDLSKIQASSFTPGLQDLGPVDPSFNLGVVSIPANGNTTRTVVVPFKRNDVISNMRINLAGTVNIGGLWIPIFGPTIVGDVPLSQSPAAQYYVYVTIQSHPQGRQITLQFINNTVGSVVNTPNLTLNVHAHLYAYPWA